METEVTPPRLKALQFTSKDCFGRLPVKKATRFTQAWSVTGLPDGLFANQKFKSGQIQFPVLVCCTKKNLANPGVGAFASLLAVSNAIKTRQIPFPLFCVTGLSRFNEGSWKAFRASIRGCILHMYVCSEWKKRELP
jgi:hypothetical protein